MIVFGILLCVLHLSQTQDFLEITDQQIVLPSAEGMSLQFRVFVRNNGTELVKNVVLRPEKCCFFDGTKQICQLFHPIGDKLSFIGPKDHISLTMIYVNYYILGRYGECNATLIQDSTVSQTVHFGSFNTTVATPYQWLPRRIREWVTGWHKCTTVDQDSFRRCEPVNCLYKYGGRRNFFDTTKQLCTETRRCYSDPESSLPAKGLDVITNSCESLEANLTTDDISFLQLQDERFMHSVYKIMKVKQIICVHGKLNANNRTCQCEYGWLSDPHDRSPYDPITQVYYMCNTHRYSTPSKLKKVTTHLIQLMMYLVLAMICACALSFLFFCCAKMWLVYGNKKEKFNAPRWFRDKSSMDDDSRQPLFGSSVQNQSSNANVQHIETSWYSTSDTLLDKAVVHSKSKGKRRGELDLNPGDVITDLQKVDIPGYWQGTCRDKRGIFPVACAEFKRDGQPLTSSQRLSR